MNDLIKIFCNIKISRNVKEYPFVKSMTKDQRVKLSYDLINCLKEADYTCAKLPTDLLKANVDFFSILYDIPICDETNVVHIAAGKNLESDVYVILNSEEHICLVSCLTREQSLAKNYEQISAVEQTIDRAMPFNATMKNGYICSNLNNTGLGLNLSYTIHGAGILNTQDDEFFLKMCDRGYDINNMCTRDGEKSQFIKIVSNRQYGITEKELVKQFDDGIDKFIQIETRQLINHYNKNKQNIDDTILKSFGILKHSKGISMDESLIMLADVLTGLRVGLLCYDSDLVSVNTVGDLLLRIFDQDVIGEGCQNYEDIKIVRANVIKEYLKQIKERED